MYRDVWFDYNQVSIRSDQMQKVSEVVTYLQQNPSIRVGLDTFNNPNETDPYSLNLLQRRVDAVRGALINAGLPGEKIQIGGIAHTRFACSEHGGQNSEVCRRVGVLIRNDN